MTTNFTSPSGTPSVGIRRTLAEFFAENGKLAVAYSGGTDSAYLLYAARLHGADVTAYFARSEFTPEFEVKEAENFTREIGCKYVVVETSVLSDENIAVNSALRCYHCKRAMMSALLAAAEKDGFSVLADGTNASDDDAERPGSRATAELGVRSPLREAGLTKDDIRAAAKEAGLSVWDKPSYSCLATRIAQDTRLTRPLLNRVERAEGALRAMGFSDFRVRVRPDGIRVQIAPKEADMSEKKRAAIREAARQIFPSEEITVEERN